MRRKQWEATKILKRLCREEEGKSKKWKGKSGGRDESFFGRRLQYAVNRLDRNVLLAEFEADLRPRLHILP